MQKIFANPAELERRVKNEFLIPDFLMMENAALSCADFILKEAEKRGIKNIRLLIVAGKGNNGGDGLAIARLLKDKAEALVFCPVEPTALEAERQYKICKKLGICITADFSVFKKELFSSDDSTFILDCLYGTGFYGELGKIKENLEAKELLDQMNLAKGIKIACDIPSALYFNSDFTLTMGTQKLALYSDRAKSVSGKIIVMNLGVPRSDFEDFLEPAAFLIENCDIRLPFRKDKAAHKGTYGHTVVIAGEKAGAAIIAADSALHFGSGLTSILRTEKSNLEQFKVNPELMICDSIPATTTAVLLGSGLGIPDEKTLDAVADWFKCTTDAHSGRNTGKAANSKAPAIVLDADMMNYPKIKEYLQRLCNINKKGLENNVGLAENKIQLPKIILTPHPKELANLYSALGFEKLNAAQATEKRLEIAEKILEKFPGLTLILKSANTIIAQKNTASKLTERAELVQADDTPEHVYFYLEKNETDFFICADGTQALAKGGSGDVLAGMAAALLAQGYTTKDAAITAVQSHAFASRYFCEGRGWDLSPSALYKSLEIKLP